VNREPYLRSRTSQRNDEVRAAPNPYSDLHGRPANAGVDKAARGVDRWHIQGTIQEWFVWEWEMATTLAGLDVRELVELALLLVGAGAL
jgi:hypothetical protein